ncbi:MAG: AAA family ATPase [Candidatus Marinimicrobia bacterium]|nr:AAA family ATPase [Candidatus Neomarinimicrobiota bacterium]
MYISSMKIRNWKNFTMANIELHETMYMIGPNAAGKSNFLDIFRFMRDIVNPKGGGLQQALNSRGGMRKTRSLAARKQPQIELEFELRESLLTQSGHPDWKYILWIKSETRGKHRPLVMKEEAYKLGRRIFSRPDPRDLQDQERLTQTHLEQINMNADYRHIAQFFEKVLYLHLVPQLLKYSDQISLRHLESDPFGQGFLEEIAAATEYIRVSRLNKIEEILIKVIPNLRKLRFVRDLVSGRPHLEMLYSHWRPNAGWQREDQFSDGTLRLIAIIWTLLSTNSMILLEEPELSLHKKVVEQIPSLIYKTRQSRRKSGGQILISTHSTDLLSSGSFSGNFFLLKPGSGGEGTRIEVPSDQDVAAMKAGLTPADILLPKTSSSIGGL